MSKVQSTKYKVQSTKCTKCTKCTKFIHKEILSQFFKKFPDRKSQKLFQHANCLDLFLFVPVVVVVVVVTLGMCMP
jgi:hypothetical protein